MITVGLCPLRNSERMSVSKRLLAIIARAHQSVWLAVVFPRKLWRQPRQARLHLLDCQTSLTLVRTLFLVRLSWGQQVAGRSAPRAQGDRATRPLRAPPRGTLVQHGMADRV